MNNIQKKEICKKFICFLFPVFIAVCSWFQMELSADYDSIKQCFSIEIKYIILNITTNIVFILSCYIVIQKIWLSCMIYSIISLIISLINYYTIQLHGMPFSIMQIKNIKTALNVIHAYKLQLSPIVVLICAICFISCIACLIVKKYIKEKSKKIKHLIIQNIILIIVGVSFIYVGYFSSASIKPRKTISWSWEEAYHKYGYMACSIEMIDQTRNVVEKPIGYSEENINNIVITKDDFKEQKPDIILILNESFYDLRQITDIKVDNPFMENIDNLKNVTKGYAIVPMIGGGTNNSEYELLTSNSLQLMRGITPFNVLNMSGANSIVSHLNGLGYQTIGAHAGPALNYSRGRVYPDMGFDEIYFVDDLKYKSYNGQRWGETDESLYQNIISWYERNPDVPKFIYMLTIQNHGGWDMNPQENDTVHVLNDYGELNNQLNEYLSSIQLSDIAFKKLLDYFENVEKPIVICMVGDHATTFAEDIIDESFSPSEKKKRLRSTPFIIWSNMDYEPQDMGYISMNYLIPTVLEIGNVKRTPWYQYLITLKEDVPALTSYGSYFDRNGNEYYYGETTPFSSLVDDYFYLEYHNLQKNKNQQLFAPYPD